MERNLPPRTLIPGAAAPYGALSLEASIQLQQHHHQESNNQSHQPFQYHHLLQPQLHDDMFPLPADPMQDFGNGCKDDRAVKSSVSDEDDTDDGHHDRGKAASQWHRVKWTSTMVKLLVTAVSYIDEDVDPDYGGAGVRSKHAMLKKKGKWKLVSTAMAERGFAVSPQQCEDKFNDLNKRYKRLTDILGRGTSCKVVENPALLEGMSISGKLKDDARKILSSKHLHYEEMCSYHNRNRLCLLDDPVLQRSLRAALTTRDKNFLFDDAVEDDQIVVSDDDDYNDFDDDREISADDHHTIHGAKELKLDHEEMQFDMSKVLGEGFNIPFADEKNPSDLHSLRLQKHHLHIKAQMLKLERRHLKWLKFSKKKDRELDKMRLVIEKMKLENKRLALELKRKELELGFKPKRIQ